METIDLKGQPLDLDITLSCGQAFRWRRREDGVWHGVVRDRLVELTVENDILYWRTYPDCDRALVEDYLRLGDDVNGIYERLSVSDARLAGVVHRFHGLRLLRQDPVETLLSFVCSAANSIPRISASVEELARLYGELVCEKDNLCYYAFPEPERLAAMRPGEIRSGTPQLGFRGESIRIASQHIVQRGSGWLAELREAQYAEARRELLAIRGVGAKIADCVCLFALDKDEAVPVDTHVRQLAHRLFLPEIKARSLTDSAYRSIAEAFRRRYGALAGWAQQFLYYEDLLRTRARQR